MVGAAVKGVSKLLKKSSKKSKKYPGIKSGMIARRNMLRDKTTLEKYSKLKQPAPKAEKLKKKPLIGKTEKGIGLGVAGTLAYQELRKGQKKAEAKRKEQLKKSTEKHKEKDKKKKEKKHHSK